MRAKKEAQRRFCCFGPENVWAHNKASMGAGGKGSSWGGGGQAGDDRQRSTASGNDLA